MLDRWLAAGDSLTIEDALHQLDVYVVEHDIKPTTIQPTVLSLSTPDRARRGTAGSNKTCHSCGGLGHVAGACPTAPSATSHSCLHCRTFTHTTSECRSKPHGWTPGMPPNQRWSATRTPTDGDQQTRTRDNTTGRGSGGGRNSRQDNSAQAIAAALALHLGLIPTTTTTPTTTPTPVPAPAPAPSTTAPTYDFSLWNTTPSNNMATAV